MLPRAFRDNDDGMTPPREPVFQAGEQSVLPVKLERHLGNEHVIHAVLGQRGERGDETGVASH